MSGNAGTQIDYILTRTWMLKQVTDCRVITEESVTSQHLPVVARLKIVVPARKETLGVKEIKMVEAGRREQQKGVCKRNIREMEPT